MRLSHCFRVSLNADKGASGSLSDWLLARPPTLLCSELMRELLTTDGPLALSSSALHEPVADVRSPAIVFNGRSASELTKGADRKPTATVREGRTEQEGEQDLGWERRTERGATQVGSVQAEASGAAK